MGAPSTKRSARKKRAIKPQSHPLMAHLPRRMHARHPRQRSMRRSSTRTNSVLAPVRSPRRRSASRTSRSVFPSRRGLPETPRIALICCPLSSISHPSPSRLPAALPAFSKPSSTTRKEKPRPSRRVPQQGELERRIARAGARFARANPANRRSALCNSEGSLLWRSGQSAFSPRWVPDWEPG